MSEAFKPEEGQHPDEKHRQHFVADEHKRMRNRLVRDQVIPVLTLSVYAFNCHEGGQGHGHLGYVADFGKEVEGGYTVAIQALEAALAELRKRVA